MRQGAICSITFFRVLSRYATLTHSFVILLHNGDATLVKERVEGYETIMRMLRRRRIVISGRLVNVTR